MNEKELRKITLSSIKDDLEPYRTLPLRILSGFIDFGIIIIFNFISLFVSHLFNQSFSFILDVFISLLFLYFYNIFMTYKFGGTFGKLVVGLRILNVKETEALNLLACILRESINILISILYIGSIIYIFIMEKKVNVILYTYYAKNFITLKIFDFVASYYYLIEIISALLNNKRRAIHDFFGGTVVKKVEKQKSYSLVLAVLSIVLGFVFIFYKASKIVP